MNRSLLKVKSYSWGLFISNKICLWNRKFCWVSIFSFCDWNMALQLKVFPKAGSLKKSFTKVIRNCFCVQKRSMWETQQAVGNLAGGLETLHVVRNLASETKQILWKYHNLTQWVTIEMKLTNRSLETCWIWSKGHFMMKLWT